MIVRSAILFLLIGSLLSGCSATNGAKTEARQYRIRDVEIYQNTPAWELAQAVRDQNAKKIAEIAKSKPKLLEFHDPVFGTTLLIWAVGTERYDAAEALLKAGANPNATTSKRDGETALHVAAMWSYAGKRSNDPKYLKLLLKYGANPDAGLVGNSNPGPSEAGMTPLMKSIGEGIEKTKALVEGGANINARTPAGNTAATEALAYGRWNVRGLKEEYAYYLIVEKHADVTQPLMLAAPPSGPQQRYEPVSTLRYWTPELDSEGYRMKMDIVKEFARQGVDYWKTEVPEGVLEDIKKLYPDRWQEYVKKY